jgi:hypothetical protein
MGDSEKFFVDSPVVLVENIRLFPTATMTMDEKLNALARLCIVISVGLYFMKYEHWLTFLIASILAIVLLKVYYSRDGKKEDFTLVPTYPNPDMQTTTVSPLFAEEWQNGEPPAYDLYTNTPPDVSFQEPLSPKVYPYSQYLTRTNLLPKDEYSSQLLNGGPKQAREYVNGAFMRHDLAYRDNMTRLYKKKLQRRFRHLNTFDAFSPFHSY